MKIKAFRQQEAKDHIHELARLRIRVFRDFPYLYDGDMAYEEDYLRTFLEAPDSILVVAFDGKKVVGASTGMPMAHQPVDIKGPWLQREAVVDDIFYYGESVLEKAYRGRGAGVRFFEEREKWAKSLKRFRLLTFCSVIRPADHPLKPAGYRPLDAFWGKRGFVKSGGLTGRISWKDIGEPIETTKSLQFWHKHISPARTPA